MLSKSNTNQINILSIAQMRNNPRLANQTITHCTIASRTYWHLLLAITKIFLLNLCYPCSKRSLFYPKIFWFSIFSYIMCFVHERNMVWLNTSMYACYQPADHAVVMHKLHDYLTPWQNRVKNKLEVGYFCLLHHSFLFKSHTHVHFCDFLYCIFCFSDHPRLRPCLKDALARASPGIKVASRLSDNATNFTAAERELRLSIKRWNQEILLSRLAQRGIRWHFNPPAASHRGWSWEQIVRSAKRTLAAVSGGVTMTDETFTTFLIEVERILNGRPITKVAADSRDVEALIPNAL